MCDNDIKIYGGENNLSIKDAEKMADAFEMMNIHRTNGNLQKARELGERLATLTPSETNDGIQLNFSELLAVKYRSQDIMYQIKVLLVFLAETILQKEIPETFLATTAINAMHNKLRNESPAFFRNISDGAAFTFYFLALRKGGDIKENMGEAFAMLCSVQKNKEGYIEAGKTVCTVAVEEIIKEIRKVEFAKA